MTAEPRLRLRFAEAWSAYLADPLDVADPGSASDVSHVTSLLELAEHYDAMLLDGFGVLNCGDMAVPGMVEVFAELQRRGVRLLILSNGSTGQTRDAVAKYSAFGYPVDADDVITSRDAARGGLARHHDAYPDWHWAVSPMGGRALDDLPGRFSEIRSDGCDPTTDGFLLVTAVAWTDAHTDAMRAALTERVRPIWVANPDVTAPFPSHFSLEPGYVARSLGRAFGAPVRWFGKPHRAVYELAIARLKRDQPSLARERILMVGDSPHTDVLGARRAGIDSCMTVDFGLLRGENLRERLTEAGVWPTYVLSSQPWERSDGTG
ncbi:MAG: HAD family hydrolase [Pseudomonadota bacterium]